MEINPQKFRTSTGRASWRKHVFFLLLLHHITLVMSQLCFIAVLKTSPEFCTNLSRKPVHSPLPPFHPLSVSLFLRGNKGGAGGWGGAGGSRCYIQTHSRFGADRTLIVPPCIFSDKLVDEQQRAALRGWEGGVWRRTVVTEGARVFRVRVRVRGADTKPGVVGCAPHAKARPCSPRMPTPPTSPRTLV